MLTSIIDPDQLEDTVFSESHYHSSRDLHDATFISHNKYSIPDKGFNAETAYQLIHNDLTLDGNPTLNLASFVNTYTSEQHYKLIKENVVKNLADADEYPTLVDLTQRNVSILGKLWNGEGQSPVGTATTGSSEAIMLGGLAMKKKWQQKMKDQGKDYYKPNIIMGYNAQVALEKFARYFDVEARLVPVSEESHHVLDITKIEELIDENTIGIFVILGSTYTGTFEDVAAVNDLLDDIQERKGIDVPIHVDGASGAFVAPFLFPELKWDFRVPRVVSINTSGHKFGLTTAGLGWIIWRDDSYLPSELIFKLRYLGSVEESYNLNFSRPGFQSIHQYYNFLHLGFEGYKEIHALCLRNARMLSNYLEKSEYFEVVSNIHRKSGVFSYSSETIDDNIKSQEDSLSHFNAGLPVVAFKLTDEFKKTYPNIPQAIISTLLRKNGWIIPNYPLPPSEESVEILRVVCRIELSDDLIHRLIKDIIKVTESLIKSYEMYNKSMVTEGAEKDKYVYQLLNAIASGGEDLNVLEQNEEHKKNHHSTFKGTC
jgi:glutamate decarboxylase